MNVLIPAKQFSRELAAKMNETVKGLNKKQTIAVLDGMSKMFGGPGVVAARKKRK